ncbi:hypothetical protein Tco_0484554, partial [Tanacetum coccineum]
FITIHDYLPQAIICVYEVLHQTSCSVGRDLDLDLNEFFLFRVSLQALIPLVEEVKYGEFRHPTPFNRSNGAKFRIGPPGYYTRTDNRPPYGEKRLRL